MAKSPKTEQDDLGREIDRLLKQLPNADPFLRGTPLFTEPIAEPITEPMSGPSAAARRAPTMSSARPVPTLLAIQLAVWGRVVAATALAGAASQWPYRFDCGPMLYLYLGVIAAIAIAGAWASVAGWRARIAPAHVVALMTMFWAAVLAAEQILPRIGYAAVTAGWSCAR